jgi:hypothetical protein
VIQPTLLPPARRYIQPMKPRRKHSSKQMKESIAAVSPETGAGAVLHGREGAGLAVLGAGLLAPNRLRQ